MFEFQNPFAFLFLLLIPFYFICRGFGLFKKVSFPLTLSDWGGTSFEWRNKFRSVISVISDLFVVLAFVCVVFALAEPVVSHRERVYTSRGTDVMFVLDVSPSMAARDIGGVTRLEAAKECIRALVSENEGAAFGIVALASDAAVAVPPTTDRILFLETLSTLMVGMLGDGSAIGMGISTAVYHLVSSRAPVKCIVLITDGENNAGSVHPDTAAEIAADNNIILHSLGIGTKGTVQLEYTDAQSGKTYSGYLESNFDVAFLRKLSEKAHGRVFEIQSIDSLSSALSEIENRVSVSQSFYWRTSSEKYYFVFVGVAMILIFASWILKRIYLQEVV